jgi:membrane protease YdiL (CAAX protease family)
MPEPELIAIGLILAVLGVGVTIWVFWPAFKGPEAARRALGTHRLAIGSIIAVLVLSTAMTLPLAPLVKDQGGLTASTFTLAAITTEVPMLIVVFGRLILPGAISWRELGFRQVGLGTLLSRGLGGGVVGLVIVALVGLLLEQFGLRSNQLEQFGFVLSEGLGSFVLLLVAAGIVAPVVEEIFFRGFLFGMYLRRQPRWLAYLAPGVLFTVLHLEPTRMDVSQMVALAVGILLLAWLLSWLYEQTESLFPSMLAHAVNNATGLLLFYFLPQFR